jgi:hypothetical protein
MYMHFVLPGYAVVGQPGREGEQKFATVVQGYIKEIEELK